MRQISCIQSVVLWGVLACLVGCSDEELIDAYTVKKHDEIQLPVSAAENFTEETAGVAGRMMAAIVLDDATAWFFKGTGGIGAFPEDAAKRFDKLLAGVRLEGTEKPTWELGEDWREKPGGGMRIANLMMDEVEFSVIKLGVPPGNERKYIVDNVNRWRGQLRLGDIDSAGLSNISHKLKTADGHDVTVVDMLGTIVTSATPPMARTSPPQSSATTSSSDPFSCDPPEHWQRQKPGMMQRAVFLVEDGDKSAKISVSTAGGAVLDNVNRWRGQVGLPPLESEDEVGAKKVKVSDIDAMQVRIIGEEGQSMIVAMVPRGGTVWYFKMMGDTVIVEKESDAFAQFLSTVRLKASGR